MRKRKKTARYSTMDLSFSASLPEDVHEMFADSVCAVKCSLDPLRDFQESICEMIVAVGVRSWREMEELVYCYVAVNSPDVHGFIADAFRSVGAGYQHEIIN
ncbi:hypothetical protein Taro_028642 [Colocasia esculenta]|uniref:Transcription repressor n=1 Tax=Colocasia esculenta TaxID=4460 RepID=A0A843VUT0_COLES|nr:hypothetical protein [Colocasia esculenta]